MRTFLAGTAAVLALLAGTAGALTALHPHPVPAPVEVRTPAPPPVPDLPAAPAPVVRVGEPTRIEIPALGVDEPLTGRGLNPDGTLDTPDFGAAAWYAPGPRPGEPGGAVVVAHVHGPDGPDLFWELATLRPGDVVRVHRPGAVAVFVVDGIEDAPKERLPYDRIWPDTARSLLRLITCGGPRTAAGYPDNTIVFAHLVATASLR